MRSTSSQSSYVEEVARRTWENMKGGKKGNDELGNAGGRVKTGGQL
jgi:hypothetical protein